MFCVIARGTQNKPIIRHNCIPPRMANIGNQCWWSWGWTGICGHFVGIHVDQQLFGELWNTYLPSEMPVSFLHVYFRGLKKNYLPKKFSCKNLYNSVAFYNSSVEMTRNACEQENGWAVFDAVPQGDTAQKQKELLEHDAQSSRQCHPLCGHRALHSGWLWAEAGRRKWAGKVWGSILTLLFLGFASDAPSPREDLNSRQTVFVCYPRIPSVLLPQWIIVCLVGSCPEVQIV